MISFEFSNVIIFLLLKNVSNVLTIGTFWVIIGIMEAFYESKC